MKQKAKDKVTLQDYHNACKEHATALAGKGKVEAEKKAKMMELDQKYAERMRGYDDSITETGAIIQQYCEDNRSEMFTGDKKSVDTGLGITVGFRLGQKKLEYGEGVKPLDLLDVLKRKKLNQYIILTESVDAKAIIKAADDDKLGNALEGVSCAVVQDESFYIKAS